MSETLNPKGDSTGWRSSVWPGPGSRGFEFLGPDGLLNRLTKIVLETALEAEIDDHLGGA